MIYITIAPGGVQHTPKEHAAEESTPIGARRLEHKKGIKLFTTDNIISVHKLQIVPQPT